MLNGATATAFVWCMRCIAIFVSPRQTPCLRRVLSRRGLIAEHGISWMLPRIVGHANALDLLMSSRRVSSEKRAHWPGHRLIRRISCASQTYAYAAPSRRFRLAERDLGDQAQLYDVRSRRSPKPPSTPTGNADRAQGQPISRRAWRAIHGEAAAAFYGS